MRACFLLSVGSISLLFLNPGHTLSANQVFQMALDWYKDQQHDAAGLLEHLNGGAQVPTPTPGGEVGTPTPTPQTMEHGGAGIAQADDGTIYLVDFVQVYRLKPDGTTELYKDLAGVLTSQSAHPQIAYDGVLDRLYVSSPGTIAKIELDTGEAVPFATSIGDISVRRDFGGMCTDAEGNLYVARTDGVFKYDPDGLDTNLGYPLNMSMRPVDVAIAPDGTLFMTAIEYPRRIDHRGVLYVKRPGGNWARALQYFPGPYYIAYQPGGFLYISDFWADKVTVVDTDDFSIDRFFPIEIWPRGILPQDDGSVLVSHIVGDLMVHTDPALTRVSPDVTVDVGTPVITLSHNTLDGHTLDVGISGVNLDYEVTAHNTVRIGDRKMTIADSTTSSVTATLPLDLFQGEEYQGNGWVLPSGEITVEVAGRKSGGVPFEGPRPGEMTQVLNVFYSGLENPSTTLARGAWLRVRALGNVQLNFPDGQYPDRYLWYGQDFFIRFDDYETFEMTVAFQHTYLADVVSGLAEALQTVEVDPAEDFSWFWDGAAIEIPAGTLPPGQNYNIAFQSSKVQPLTDVIRTGAAYSVHFDPEPDRLFHPITIECNYRPSELNLEEEEVRFGLYDDGAFFGVEGVSRNSVDRTYEWTLPAGSYATAKRTDRKSSVVHPGSYTVNTVLSFWSTWGWPSSSYQLAGHDFIVQSDPNVDPDYALACLEALREASSTYAAHGFDLSFNQLHVWITDLGQPYEVGGTTTRGVFGTPWVRFNDDLSTEYGMGLDWNVAHELFHVVQRQMTTNIVTHWFDEATAQWGASIVYPDSTYYIDGLSGLKTGADFPSASIPTTFVGLTSHYSTEQQYAAMAMMKYIAEKRGATGIRGLHAYDQINQGEDFWDALESVTGQAIGTFCHDFGLAYWTQDYDKAREHAWPLEAFSEHLGTAAATVNLSHFQLPLSSDRLTISLDATFTMAKISATTGRDEHKIYIYGDPNPSRFNTISPWHNLGVITSTPGEVNVSLSGWHHLRFVSINSASYDSSSVNGTVAFSND